MRSGPFHADTLGKEWAGYRHLALTLEEAQLSERQAEVILLYCRGFGYTAIGTIIGVRKTGVYDALRRAVKRVIRRHPELYDLRQRWVRVLLKCFRNAHPGGKRPALVEDANGRLVTVRSPLVSEDDFRVWRSLPTGEEYLALDDMDLFCDLLTQVQWAARGKVDA